MLSLYDTNKELLERIRQEARQYSQPDADDAERSVEEQRAERLANDHEEQKLELKESMFKWIKYLVSLWLLFIVLFLSGYLYLSAASPDSFLLELLGVVSRKDPILDKEIIMTLLATTTINILGLPYVITKGLFS